MTAVIQRYKTKRVYQRLDKLMLKMASGDVLTEYAKLRKVVPNGYGS